MRRSYVDWNNYATSNYVKVYWITGAAIASSVMCLALAYIVVEWCLQSHLSTADFKNATRGLQRARRFRYLTSPFRIAIHSSIEASYAARTLMFKIFTRTSLVSKGSGPRASRRSVRWTRQTTCQKPEHDHGGFGRPLTSIAPGRHRADSSLPLIAGRDADGNALVVDTSSLRHSHENDADTPSPRTSYEPIAHQSPQQSLRVPTGGPRYDRPTSLESEAEPSHEH
jgi:hypothetical protein